MFRMTGHASSLPGRIEQARHPFNLPLAVEQEAALNDDLVSLIEAVVYEVKITASARLVCRVSTRAELQFDKLVSSVFRQPVSDPPSSGIEHSRHRDRQFALVARVLVGLVGRLLARQPAADRRDAEPALSDRASGQHDRPRGTWWTVVAIDERDAC